MMEATAAGAPRHRWHAPRARWLARYIALGSILLPLLAAAAPVPYEASYGVRVYGLRGELTLRQAPADLPGAAGCDVWRFRSVLEAKGIASLFVRGETVEDAYYEVRPDGRLRPLAVHVDDPIADSTRDVRFHWPRACAAAEAVSATAAGGTVDGVSEGEPFALEIPGGTLERALLMPAIALDLRAAGGADTAPGAAAPAAAEGDAPAYRFRVVEDGKLRDYSARLIREEQVEGPDGPLDTLVFEHQRDGSSRATTFWLAPSLAYAPVRIEQRKDDKSPHLRAKLKDYRTLDTTAPGITGSD